MAIAVPQQQALKEVMDYETAYTDGEQSALQRIAKGDTGAVEDCLERFGPLVWTLASRWLKNSADAEDATQEIFIELWKSAGRFDPSKASETTFITMIARRKLIDRTRKSSVSPLATSLSLETVEIPYALDSSNHEVADEASKAVRCMKKLNHQQQQVMRLSVQEGVSQSQIAKRRSMPLGPVKSFARRALIQLRDCMKRREGDSDRAIRGLVQ